MRVAFGDCVVDLGRRQLERAGVPVHLSPKAFAVLEVLLAERPRAVSKRLLLERVWPDVIVEEQNAKNAVVEIRAALGEHSSAIRTVSRFGYAFASDVVEQVYDAAAHPHYWLLYLSRFVPITTTTLELGRDPACGFCLDLPGVSRRHARITATADGFAIVDLDSKNGTFVDDQRVESTALRDGSRIRIGSAQLTFRQRSQFDSTASESGAAVAPVDFP